VALNDAIVTYGSKSLEARRHRLFTAIIIVHEYVHWLRTCVSHQHGTPPGLQPKAYGFQSGVRWNDNRGYMEGEAGFWLEEVAVNGIIGYVENESPPNNVGFLSFSSFKRNY
jgi:hypothetical protein